MPVKSFSIQEIIPNLVSGLITYIPNVYKETHGLSGMASEARPQTEPKIRVVGKVYIRPVAKDIPESTEATLINDTKFSDEYFTAPEYGKGFSITTNDLIQNQEYQVNFKSMTIEKSQAPKLVERVRNASDLCIEMIKRSADDHVRQILRTGTIQFDNYQTIDFGRDANNSETITTANLKWTIANAATMTPYKDIDRWTTQVADRGNCGDDEFIILMSRSAFTAYANSDAYKDDSNQRRNFKVDQVRGVSSTMNINIPKGAVYRESVLKNTVGIAHIFTFNQTFTDDAGDPEQWLATDEVYVIATGNIFKRQPVNILTMDLIAQSTQMRRVLAAVPSMKGWLITPEWHKTTNRALVMGIYRKFLTQMLTPNKTFTAITNS